MPIAEAAARIELRTAIPHNTLLSLGIQRYNASSAKGRMGIAKRAKLPRAQCG
jgi:hypothetical protein